MGRYATLHTFSCVFGKKCVVGNSYLQITVRYNVVADISEQSNIWAGIYLCRYAFGQVYTYIYRLACILLACVAYTYTF
jgi:hypothetical protein